MNIGGILVFIRFVVVEGQADVSGGRFYLLGGR
jgi:hypothetical protein